MSLTRVLDQLSTLSVAERQLLVLRAIEIDDSELSPEEEQLIAERLEAHREDPSSSVSFEAMKSSLRHPC
ncbi:MAG: addiction module protein [Verrucomicrobiaceae bacterium]|nr:MAG: addiction module protein [Verrucomicrobiaceae bacterium]